jgi:hypothetical protein
MRLVERFSLLRRRCGKVVSRQYVRQRLKNRDHLPQSNCNYRRSAGHRHERKQNARQFGDEIVSGRSRKKAASNAAF